MPYPDHLRPVLSIGECLIDLIATDRHDLATADGFAIRHGGAPANVAVALARLGVPVRLGTVLGDDPFGHRLRDALRAEGVDVSATRLMREAATSLALAWTNARGDGEFQLLRLADRLFDADDAARSAPQDASALVAGSVVLADPGSRAGAMRALTLAHDAGVPVVFDVNLRPTLWVDPCEVAGVIEPFLRAATLLKVSMDDARGVWGDATPEAVFGRLEDSDALAVVVTDGARGVWYRVRGAEPVALPVYPVAVVEPTGAGDAFTAALTMRLRERGWTAPDEADVRFAMAAGALATTTPGAWPGLPTHSEVERFLVDRA